MRNKPATTPLFAEYLALKKGMLEYVKADGQGPLTVTGDSQTVIYQMRGIYPIMDDDIWHIHRDITNIIREYELDIHFRWVPRLHNKQADRLSKTKQKVRIEYPNDREFIIDIRNSPAIGKLRKTIAAMNATPFPTNAMYKRLHVSTRDILSDKDLFELREMAGQKATRLVIETFPGKRDKNKYYQAQALRWMLRGLAVDLAIKTVKFDLLNKKNGVSNSITKQSGSVKVKSKRSSSKKKTRTSCRGAKYYLNRQTFAF